MHQDTAFKTLARRHFLDGHTPPTGAAARRHAVAHREWLCHCSTTWTVHARRAVAPQTRARGGAHRAATAATHCALPLAAVHPPRALLSGRPAIVRVASSAAHLEARIADRRLARSPVHMRLDTHPPCILHGKRCAARQLSSCLLSLNTNVDPNHWPWTQDPNLDVYSLRTLTRTKLQPIGATNVQATSRRERVAAVYSVRVGSSLAPCGSACHAAPTCIAWSSTNAAR